MSTAPASVSFDLPLKEIDGELRVRDVDLAEALGYDRARSIRVAIKRNAAVLKEFGNLHQRDAKSEGRGRPGTEYHLNREQAIFITTQSTTKAARAMTVYIVKVFDRYLEGRLVAVDEEAERKLEVLLNAGLTGTP